MSNIARFLFNLLIHVDGAGLEHFRGAITAAEQVLGLAPQQSTTFQVATLDEHGNKYEIWVAVKRQ